jgi:ABC-2 type transport system ATP-binding protein
MLHIKQLQKKFGETPAIHLDELTIQKGEFVGLVGNNGAGKTTLICLILDLLKSNGGSIELFGHDIKSSTNWKLKVGSFIDDSFLIPHLSPYEFLSYVGNLYGVNQAELDAFVAKHVQFLSEEFMFNKLIRELSKGNKNKVGVLAAILGQKELVILDEPFANLDPTSQVLLKDILSEVHNQGTAIFLSSHDLIHVSTICQRVLVLNEGRIQKDFEVNPSTLIELEAYFKSSI